LSPSQVLLPFGDDAHGVQADPQALRLVASTQRWLHGFLPIGHLSSQTMLMATHWSPQTCSPAAQVAPHLTPSQVA
jgi:hypothetical protein